MKVLVVILLGWGFLQAFYRAVASEWPHSYFSVGEGSVNERISRSPLRYATFRFVPSFVVAIFAGVTLQRLEQPVVLPAVLIGVLHVGWTSARAALQVLARGRARQSPVALASHIVLSVLLLGTAALGGLLAWDFRRLVPAPQEISTALWTAAAAGVLGSLLVRLTDVSPAYQGDLFEGSRRKIGETLWAMATVSAMARNAEPRLVHAFMLVENLQRPAWVRRLEQVAGRFAERGTYGPLQAAGAEGTDDFGTLDRAIDEHFSGQRVPRYTSFGYDHSDNGWLWWFAHSYNPLDGYADDVVSAYHWLQGYRETKALAYTDAHAADQLPVVQVRKVKWTRSNMEIAGDALCDHGVLAVAQVAADGERVAEEEVRLEAAQIRSEFTIRIAPVSEAVTVEVYELGWDERRGEGEHSRLLSLPVPAHVRTGSSETDA